MSEATADAVDLIVPARNERQNIEPLLDALPREHLRHVIVVDNGSTDGTGELAAARGATVVREPYRGYGAACLAGICWIKHRMAEGEPAPLAVAFLDADLADDPSQLPHLAAPITADDADMIVGVRTRHAEPGALDPHQRFGNWLACRLIGAITGRQFTDLGPMRVIRFDALQRLNMQDRTWGWTVEMNFKAAQVGLRCLELDVPYRRRRAGRSKISGSLTGSARAGAKILATIARLWWRQRRESRSGDDAVRVGAHCSSRSTG